MRTMTVTEVLAAHPDLTYRQLDYWLGREYLRTAGEPHPGSGIQRSLTTKEVKVLEAMLSLTAVGVQPARASEIARQLVAGKEVRLGSFVLSPAA
jgi:hypothetical protein